MSNSMKLDPVTGPLTRDEFAKCVDAPFGGAIKIIREYDPQWGRAPGEKFRWKVRCRSDCDGTAYIMAADKKEANALADKIGDGEVDWDYGSGDFEVLSVEPDKK